MTIEHASCPAQSALLAVPREDLLAVLGRMTASEVGAVGRAAGLRMKAAAVGDRNGVLVVARLPRLSPIAAHNVAVVLTNDLRPAFLKLVDGGELSDEDAAAAMERGLPGLLARWPRSIVQLFLVVIWEAGAITERLLASLSEIVAAGEAAPAPAAAPAVAEPAPSPPPAPDPVRVTASLDALLAEAIRRACLATPDVAAAAPRAVAELVAVDPTRPGSWFLAGLLAGYDEAGVLGGPGRPAAAALAREYDLGHVVAAVDRDPDAAAGIVTGEDVGVLARLVGHPLAGAAAATVVDAAMVDRPTVLADLLDAVDQPFPGWPAVVDRLADGEVVADSGVREGALRAADAMLMRWTLLTTPAPAQAERLEQAAARLALAAVSCQRRRGDLHGAARAAAAVPVDRLDRAHLAWLAEERALLAAELVDPSTLTLCPPAEQRADLVARLTRARPSVDAALEADPQRSVARLLRGALALATGDDRQAASDLAAADSYAAPTRPSPAANRGSLTEAFCRGPLRFARGLAVLRLLEPGTDAAATDLVLDALAAGYVPPADALVDAAEALAAHGAARTAEVIAFALDAYPSHGGLLAAARGLAREGDPAALAAVGKAAADDRRPLRERFELHADALAGAGLGHDTAMIGEHVDGLERVARKLADADLDRRWARLLAEDDAVRTALGPVHADLARVDVLRRTGALDEATAAVRGLFHRAVSGQASELDPGELVDLLTSLSVTADDEVTALRRLVAADERPPDAVTDGGLPSGSPPRPVRVLFVGGNETQVRYHDDLDAAVAARYDGQVAVEWFATGWASNWSADAERIERRYPAADVVVLLSFMRTMLGRRLRRTAGEAGLPWVACTGHGRAALESAIARAVAFAVDPRRPSTARAARDRDHGDAGGSVCTRS